jgi:hypothetical protein
MFNINVEVLIAIVRCWGRLAMKNKGGELLFSNFVQMVIYSVFLRLKNSLIRAK